MFVVEGVPERAEHLLPAGRGGVQASVGSEVASGGEDVDVRAALLPGRARRRGRVGGTSRSLSRTSYHGRAGSGPQDLVCDPPRVVRRAPIRLLEPKRQERGSQRGRPANRGGGLALGVRDSKLAMTLGDSYETLDHITCGTCGTDRLCGLEGPDFEGTPRFSREKEQRSAPLTGRDSGSGTVKDMAARKWFSISIEAGTTLKPDALIELTVTYTAHFATHDADLFVTLPEIESAKLSDWGDQYKKPLGTRRPPEVESSQAFGAGDRVTQSVAFSVPAAGIYRVHATARSSKVTPDETKDRTQPSAYKTLWLLVDETGGRAPETFDADVIPDGLIKQPGPFREDHGGKPRPAQARFSGLVRSFIDALRRLGGAESSSCARGHVCVQLVYEDQDLGEIKPLPGVKYEYAFIDPQTGYEEWGTSGYADSNGEFEVVCPGPNDEFEGFLSFDDGRARIVPRTNQSLSLGYCGQTQQYEMPSVEGRTWLNAYYSIGNSRDMFYDRAKITIKVNDPDEGRTSPCAYQSGSDGEFIRIQDNDSWGCVWGAYGMFVLPHEYGHALHHTRLGGLPEVGAACGRDHHPDVPTNLGCAYAEGWADYHGFVTQPTIYATILGNAWFTADVIENNAYLQTNEDGSIDEGVVAAFFSDLIDPADEADDWIDLSGDAVSRVMSGCRVYARGWHRPRGVDDLIWCLEAAVDPDVTGGDDYFEMRTSHATNENQSNQAWNEDDIRTLWMKDLYGEDGS